MGCSPVVNIYCNCNDGSKLPSVEGTNPQGRLIHLDSQANYGVQSFWVPPRYCPFEPVHVPINVISAALFMEPDSGTTSTTATMEASLVVLHNDGTELRTISTQTIELFGLPFYQWMPFTLVATSADLTVGVNEVLSVRALTINPDGNYGPKIQISALVEVPV
jgi:hypothetical protein